MNDIASAKVLTESKIYDILARTDAVVAWFSNFLFSIPVYGDLKKAFVPYAFRINTE